MPERHNPSSVESYIQICHNLVAQAQEKYRYLEYEESEAKYIAHVITYLKIICYAQHFVIGKGLKEFPDKGPPAVKAVLSKMHQSMCFNSMAVKELT